MNLIFPPTQSAPQLASLNSVKGSHNGAGFEISSVFLMKQCSILYITSSHFKKKRKKFDFLSYFIVMLTGWVPISLFYVHFGVSRWKMGDGNAKILSEKFLF